MGAGVVSPFDAFSRQNDTMAELTGFFNQLLQMVLQQRQQEAQLEQRQQDRQFRIEQAKIRNERLDQQLDLQQRRFENMLQLREQEAEEDERFRGRLQRAAEVMRQNALNSLSELPGSKIDEEVRNANLLLADTFGAENVELIEPEEVFEKKQARFEEAGRRLSQRGGIAGRAEVPAFERLFGGGGADARAAEPLVREDVTISREGGLSGTVTLGGGGQAPPAQGQPPPSPLSGVAGERRAFSQAAERQAGSLGDFVREILGARRTGGRSLEQILQAPGVDPAGGGPPASRADRPLGPRVPGQPGALIDVLQQPTIDVQPQGGTRTSSEGGLSGTTPIGAAGQVERGPEVSLDRVIRGALSQGAEAGQLLAALEQDPSGVLGSLMTTLRNRPLDVAVEGVVGSPLGSVLQGRPADVQDQPVEALLGLLGAVTPTGAVGPAIRQVARGARGAAGRGISVAGRAAGLGPGDAFERAFREVASEVSRTPTTGTLEDLLRAASGTPGAPDQELMAALQGFGLESLEDVAGLTDAEVRALAEGLAEGGVSAQQVEALRRTARSQIDQLPEAERVELISAAARRQRFGFSPQESALATTGNLAEKGLFPQEIVEQAAQSPLRQAGLSTGDIIRGQRSGQLANLANLQRQGLFPETKVALADEALEQVPALRQAGFSAEDILEGSAGQVSPIQVRAMEEFTVLEQARELARQQGGALTPGQLDEVKKRTQGISQAFAMEAREFVDQEIRFVQKNPRRAAGAAANRLREFGGSQEPDLLDLMVAFESDEFGGQGKFVIEGAIGDKGSDALRAHLEALRQNGAAALFPLVPVSPFIAEALGGEE